MYLLLNAAMVPNAGTYHYRQIPVEQAAEWLRFHGHQARSYIGYPQTARHLEQLCPGLQVAISRERCRMAPGDQALVCRLAYRLENPATKGQAQPEDWEYGILDCWADTLQVEAPTDLPLAHLLPALARAEREWLAPRLQLTEREAQLLCDAANGLRWDEPGVTLLWAQVVDAMRLEALDRRWEIDGEHLIERLRQLSPLQCWLLAGAIDRFWQEQWQTGWEQRATTVVEQLQRAGFPLAPSPFATKDER